MSEEAWNNLKTARWYRKHLNWSVFPVHGIQDGKCTCGNPNCDRPAKHAVVKWEAYQKTLPTLEQVSADFAGRPFAGIALATGAVSNVVVLDIDQKGDGEETLRDLTRVLGELPNTVESLTGGGGRHIFFLHPGFEVKNRVRFAPGLDFRGDGGYVVLPRSSHASGQTYEWEASSRPDEVKLVPMPEWLRNMVTETAAPDMGGGKGEGPDWSQIILNGAPEGARNDTATRLAGRLFRHGLQASEVWAWLQLWNRNMQAPLSDDELFRTVKSVAQREARARQQRGRTG